MLIENQILNNEIEENVYLNNEITSEEIKKVINGLKSRKSPGIDGIQNAL